MPKTDLDTALGGDDPERSLAGDFRDELLALCQRYDGRGLPNVRITSILAGEVEVRRVRHLPRTRS